jgi:hypothetical protein
MLRMQRPRDSRLRMLPLSLSCPSHPREVVIPDTLRVDTEVWHKIWRMLQYALEVLESQAISIRVRFWCYLRQHLHLLYSNILTEQDQKPQVQACKTPQHTSDHTHLIDLSAAQDILFVLYHIHRHAVVVHWRGCHYRRLAEQQLEPFVDVRCTQ